MKIKTISRSSDNYLPVRADDSQRLPRNLDPALHPFERAREYTRALNATKLDRVFAQPFVGQMGRGHIDGVYSIAKNTRTLAHVATGSGDGVVKLWDLASQEEALSVQAHSDIVRGMTVDLEGNLLSCSADKTVKLWDVAGAVATKEDHIGSRRYVKGGGQGTGGASEDEIKPLATYKGTGAFMGVDHHRDEPKFVTAGDSVELWDSSRSNRAVANLSWGADNVSTVKFNMTETSVVATAGSDRSIVLYDIRTSTPVQKLVTTLRTNALAWNPMEAFIFCAGSEDHNVYLYDMRNLDKAQNVMKDHVAAVMDVDFDPTGQEIVSASYDRTLRIYRQREGHSRDIYHTKRMQHVFCVRFTSDSKFIVSGSDDGNVRLWRRNASERVGIMNARQLSKKNYDDALKERYKHMHDIRRISRHRQVPIAVKRAKDTKREELAKIKHKEDNLRRNSKKGTVPYVPERKKHILGTAINNDQQQQDAENNEDYDEE
ncbi:uncharacterized protein SAPINGB_P002725 [Magnusiomyces paraingens]|uniref:DDB1- and CUL4-associated factor 13 n=1 Tax=Magnusiomyces paraingens TaxID=2606893 RepID=A0A5E8BHL1_9ASCO|nr:uncharacterized protein SAPINGB_P002725 [Saprochaete ingens]VVT50362.1 unnamed protein product [Saprochaete ingens]